MGSLGEELRKQRELRQISLREISDATKVNIRFLEALEEDDYTHLPGGQFNKGFIRAYSCHIGIDAEKMIEAYLESVERKGVEPAAPPARLPERRADPRRVATIALLVVLLAAVLVGGALLTWFLTRGAKPAGPAAPPRTSRPAEPAGAARSLDLRLTGLEPLSVRATCDGALLFDGPLAAGQARTLRCDGELKLTLPETAELSVGPSRGPAAGAPAGSPSRPATARRALAQRTAGPATEPTDGMTP